MSIHNRIREGRARLDLTEQAFADRVGVSRGAVQQWEKDGGTAPNRKRQQAVANLLGLSVAELMAPHPESATIHHIPQAGVTVGEALEVLAAQFAGVDESTRAIIVILLGDLLAGRRTAGATAAAIEAMLKSAGDMPKKAGNGVAP